MEPWVVSASLILLVVSAAYLMVGGLRAAYWTDVIQRSP